MRILTTVTLLLCSAQGALAAPAFVCETNSRRVVVDEVAQGAFRYSAWKSATAATGSPELVLQNGNLAVEGTGACRARTWTFRNGKYEYSVTDSVQCAEQKPPQEAVGRLTVSLDGIVKGDWWCVAGATAASPKELQVASASTSNEVAAGKELRASQSASKSQVDAASAVPLASAATTAPQRADDAVQAGMQATTQSTPTAQAHSAAVSLGAHNDAGPVSGATAGFILLGVLLGVTVVTAIAAKRSGKSRVVGWGGGFLAGCVAFGAVGMVILPKRDGPTSGSVNTAATRPVGSAGAMPVAVEAKAAPDTPDWYLVAAVISEETVLGAGPMRARCQREENGPAAMIDIAQRAGQLESVKDREVENGKPVDVEVRIAQGGARFIRGARRCERVVTEINAEQARVFAKRQDEVSRYK